MTRKIAVLVGVAILLAGCGQSGPTDSYGLARARYPSALAEQVAPGQGDAFAYIHTLELAMKRSAVRLRFERARERCLKDASLHCKLLSANIQTGQYGDEDSVSGSLTLALPHDQVAMFEKGLLAPVDDESAGDVSVRSQSTQAENVGQEVTDADRKLAQLTDYGDRLTALSKRPNVSVDDLIK